jgi:choline dehydrogenase-like flavoprotein
MVAEQRASNKCAVWKGDCSGINRRWELDENFVIQSDKAINSFIERIRHLIKDFQLFTDWSEYVFSSSHHSGTARMSSTPNDGVCDENGRVYGLSNLFVCDGSVIPGSGFVNTGLTITALAMRMADNFTRLAEAAD